MRSLSREVFTLAVLGAAATGFAALKAETFTISGTTEVPGTVMQGLPGDPVTDATGHYSATVEHGWSGTVAPRKEGYVFSPSERIYVSLATDCANQDYSAELQILTISDRIAVDGTPIPGVRVSANNDGGSDTTDSRGRYRVEVPYGWSGEITLEKEGYEFRPASKSFTDVTTNIKDGVPETSKRRRPSVRPPRVTVTHPPMDTCTERLRILVIPTTEVKAEEFTATTEDMRVMLHILDEKLRDGPRLIHGVFADYGDFFDRGSGAIEALYIQDYGAIFFAEVHFPISAAPQAQDQSEQGKEPVDPVWQRAKKKVLSPKASSMGGWSQAQRQDGPQTVQELETELVKTLKHASNIRHLKPDEWIIVSVIGRGSWARGAASSGFEDYAHERPAEASSGRGRGMGGYEGAGGFGYGGYGGGFGGGSGGAGGTYGTGFAFGYGSMGGYVGQHAPSAILTARVKKGDVDAYAKGELDIEQFRERVKTLVH
jgi:hypothetical protein